MVTAAPASEVGQNKILARMPAPSQATFLPAGHSHHLHAKRAALAAARELDLATRSREAARRAARDKALKDLLSGGPAGDTHYDILGLSDLGLEATADDVREAYRRLILVYHPDKATAAEADIAREKAAEAGPGAGAGKGKGKGADADAKKGASGAGQPQIPGAIQSEVEEEKKETIDERFARLTLAHDTLTDPKRRRDYDSTYGEIDDTVPGAKDIDAEDPETFYKVFGAAFRRNARWSEATPVPKLGDGSTSWDDVSAFYEFWFDFQSWRKFPEGDKHRVEEAGDRDERRWMEQENKRARVKREKEESSRLLRLAETAHKLDPRVRKHMDEEKERKNAKKNARRIAAEQAAAEEAAKKAAEEEAAQKAAEDAKKARDQAKKDKEKAKKLLRKQRARFRELGQECRADHVEDLVLAHKEEATLLALCDRVEGGEITAQAAIDEFLASR